jgi:integrase
MTCRAARALQKVLHRMKVTGATAHGMRSAFRDWAGDKTSFPREVCEAALAHAVGSKVERDYRRGDALAKRRDLMESWAGYCAKRSASTNSRSQDR